MKSSIRLDGVTELSAALDELGHEVAEKVGAAAVRAAARELQREGVETAPRGPGRHSEYGHLYQNIRVRRERATKPYTVRYVVTTGSAFWGYFLEVGTARMPARPWARPLFDRMKLKLVDTILDQLRIGTERAATRAARKAARKPRAGIGHNGGPAIND